MKVNNVLLWVQVLLLVFVFYKFRTFVFNGNYFPVYADEGIYLNAARLFSETGSLMAPESIEEKRSMIGGFNWYGPAYHILYGTFEKIVGLKFISIPVFHLFIFILLNIYLFTFPIDWNNKLLFSILLTTSIFVTPFVFTYFPEIIHVLMSLFLLKRIFKTEFTVKDLLYFSLLVLAFSFIRISFVFWIFLVFFIPMDNSTFKLKALLSVTVLVMGFIYWKLCCAPPFAAGLKDLHQIENNSVLKNILTNFHSNLLFLKAKIVELNSEFLFFGFLNLCLFISIFLSKGNKADRMKSTGLFFVSTVVTITMLVLYTAKPHFLIKQIVFLVPAIIYSILLLDKKVKVALIAGTLLLIPSTLKKINENVEYRIQSALALKQHSSTINALALLKNYIETEDKSHVNIQYNFNDFLINSKLASCFLPVSKNGIPLLYTTNIVSVNKPFPEKFKLHDRIEIEYLIAREFRESIDLTLKIKLEPEIYLYKYK